MKGIPGFLHILFLFTSIITMGSNDERDPDKRIEKIHNKILSVDSHTDTPLRLLQKDFDISQRHDPYRESSKVDFPRMKEGRLDAAFFGVFVSQGKRDPAAAEKARQRINVLFDTIYAMLKYYPDMAGLALDPGDAWHLKKQGKRAIFIGIENGFAIGNNIDLVKTYYEKGARYMTLCHTRNNDICDSSTDTAEFNGLSEFGRNVVLFMNRTGMMIDVTHISDKAFYQVLAISKAPVIASHSCARALCNNPRNLDDNMLKALAMNGGVIQVCLLSAYLKIPDPNPAGDSARSAVRKKWNNFENLNGDEMKTARKEWRDLDDKYPQELAKVADAVDHIDHIVKVAGIDHVGIGTDFDGGGGIEGCYDVSQMKNITKELVKRGYSEKDIGKIWGGNLMHVMSQVRQTAEKIEKEISKPCGCD